MMLKFPPNFLWGSATSAYQVEGGIENCDWAKAYPAGKAADHYNRYEEDFDLVKKLNQNAHRFSIEWSRIEPEEGRFDKREIEHYRKVLLALKKRNITSFVTLWHWTNPIWLAKKGGWANRKTVDYFARYTEIIVKELGDLIDFWVTLNEPMNHVSFGYITGKFPPQKRNIFLAWNALQNLIKAHKVAYRIIHKKYHEAQVSISKQVNYFEPARQWFPIEQLFATIVHQKWNHYFLSKIKHQLDYIGLSYYFHDRIVWYPPFKRNLNKEISDLGWEIYPEGIYYVLKYLGEFKKPLYILENGLADAKDQQRKDFIRDHLYWVHKAIQEGVDVRGYFHWSLIDNFEWAEGYTRRFGLAHVDFETMKRTLRPSAVVYAEICKTNQLEL